MPVPAARGRTPIAFNLSRRSIIATRATGQRPGRLPDYSTNERIKPKNSTTGLPPSIWAGLCGQAKGQALLNRERGHPARKHVGIGIGIGIGHGYGPSVHASSPVPYVWWSLVFLVIISDY